MLSTLLGGADKKADKKSKKDIAVDESIKEARELFNIGRFPVVTTQVIENRPIAKVLGLVCCRGFDSEEAFFGMAAMAVKKGAQGIIGYNENVAFHPDGSKYFSCFGTAIMFQREGRSDLLSDTRTIKEALRNIPTAPAPQGYAADSMLDTGDKLNLQTPPRASQKIGSHTMPLAKERVLSQALHANLAHDTAEAMQAHTAENMLNEGGLAEGLSAEGLSNDVSENFDLRQNQMPLGQMPARPDLRLGARSQIHSPVMAQQKMEEPLPEGRIAQPSEDEDPVLKRLLASQKRQATPAWQQ